MQVWFVAVPSDDLQKSTGRGGVRHTVVLGSTAPATSARARDGRVLAGWCDRLLRRAFVDVGEAYSLHRVEVIQVAPELLEAVCGRQSIGVITKMVLAELPGVVAEIDQELGDRWRAGPKIGRATRKLRGDHARAQWVHAGEEGVAPRRAALLGVVGQELRAFLSDAIDVGCLTNRETLVVNTRLHPADVVAHDEKDVGLGSLRERGGRELRRHEKHGGHPQGNDSIEVL